MYFKRRQLVRFAQQSLWHGLRGGKVPDRTRILLACMPKSASTFLYNCIGDLPDMTRVQLARPQLRMEENIDFQQALRVAHKNYICQMHVRNNENTQALCREFDIKRVVLVRNLADCLVSTVDHIRNETDVLVLAHLLPGQKNLDDQALQNLLADHLLPWYVSFYLSWLEDRNALFVTFDDVRTAPQDTIARVLDFAGVQTAPQALEAIVTGRQKSQTKGRGSDQKIASRFNQGVSGRGQNISDYAKKRIEELLSHYPDVDFSPIA
jgi:hypothetical protein